ncbi:unnamed protein product [Ascophyllum nodosum]
MFGDARSAARNPLLPTPGNGRYGGGGSLDGAAKRTRRNLSKSFIATVVWGLASVGLIYWGGVYSARQAESSTFTCNHCMCKFEDKKGDTVELTSIPRARLIRADIVRLTNEVIVPNYTTLKRATQRKLGHSYAIVYMKPDSEDDDDESCDSYEDGDDSCDSYDHEEDSSEDEGGWGAAPRVSQEEKEAATRRRAEERARYTRERDEKRKRDGRPPLREPDQPLRLTPEISALLAEDAGVHDEQDDRFPGDAGNMEQNYRKKARHHVHSRHHHGSGEKKVEGGWRHRNRQRHGHEQIKKLWTRFSLGRSKARERKAMIDKYARKEIHKVEFTDFKRWSAGGVWMVMLGFVSSAFCLVAGNFQP